MIWRPALIARCDSPADVVEAVGAAVVIALAVVHPRLPVVRRDEVEVLDDRNEQSHNAIPKKLVDDAVVRLDCGRCS